MILNNSNLQQVRRILDEQSGLDAALLARCGDLLHLGKYDQAVHTAFILLEERLRQFVGKEGLTGVVMVQNLFSKHGTITRLKGLSEKERTQYKNLFEAAFSLYRNPAAHTVTNYDVAMGKAIIGLVNLLLLFLGDPDQLPPIIVFPKNVEKVMSFTEEIVDLQTAHQLRLFLSRCYQMGLEVRNTKATYWVPFKVDTIQLLDSWNEPRRHPLALFYVMADKEKPGLHVPLELYYTRVVGLDIKPLRRTLRQLGFRPTGKGENYELAFSEKTDEAFFDAFLNWIEDLINQLATLEQAA